jgi:nitrate reductase gamma subunit
MHDMSPLLQFAEDRLQIIALSFMAIVYLLKIRWILRFPASRDRQAPTGDPSTNAPRGARYSLFNIGMPWAMSSTRQHPFFYAQFVIFHIGVTTSIAMSFLIPYAPGLIAGGGTVLALQLIFAAAAAVGVSRMVRRITDRYIRSISSPDDYFSLALLTIWFVSSILAAPNNRQASEAPLLAYFFLTAFFLIYVPFSKISHYLYYPFTRWYLGKTLGHRGVYPLRHRTVAN